MSTANETPWQRACRWRAEHVAVVLRSHGLYVEPMCENGSWCVRVTTSESSWTTLRTDDQECSALSHNELAEKMLRQLGQSVALEKRTT